jgi:chromosome segregation ATPase
MEGHRIFDFAKDLLSSLHSVAEEQSQIESSSKSNRETQQNQLNEEYLESAIVESTTAWDGVVLTEVLRKENRDMKSRCTNLLLQLRTKDNQLLELQREVAGDTHLNRQEPTRRSNAKVAFVDELCNEVDTYQLLCKRFEEQNSALGQDFDHAQLQYNCGVQRTNELQSELVNLQGQLRRSRLSEASLSEKIAMQKHIEISLKSEASVLKAAVEQQARRISQVQAHSASCYEDSKSERRLNSKLATALEAAEETAAASVEGLRASIVDGLRAQNW